MAATYDEWGYWLDRLFELDPGAILGQYESRDDLHRVWPRENPRSAREPVRAFETVGADLVAVAEAQA